MTDSWNAPIWFGEFGANNDPNPDQVDFQARCTPFNAKPPKFIHMRELSCELSLLPVQLAWLLSR